MSKPRQFNHPSILQLFEAIHASTQQFETQVYSKLSKIQSTLDIILNKEIQMSQNLTDLQAQVAANEQVESSALTLITGISARIDAAIKAAANGDTDALPSLSSGLKASADALAAAVAANTPSEK